MGFGVPPDWPCPVGPYEDKSNPAATSVCSLCENAASDGHHDLVVEYKRLRAALEMIAGRRQCIDNLMSNEEIAIDALDHGREYVPCHLTENG